jgi:hypothetical protein
MPSDEALRTAVTPHDAATANPVALSGPPTISVPQLKNESTNRAIYTFPRAGKALTLNHADYETKPGHDTSKKPSTRTPI